MAYHSKFLRIQAEGPDLMATIRRVQEHYININAAGLGTLEKRPTPGICGDNLRTVVPYYTPEGVLVTLIASYDRLSGDLVEGEIEIKGISQRKVAKEFRELERMVPQESRQLDATAHPSP